MGEPLRFTTKGQEPKTYQTPYGPVSVPRHVYQTGEGGTTFCPLERNARVILTSTPRSATTRISVAMRSHSGTLGAGFTRSSCSRNARAWTSSARAPSRQAARRGGKSPVSAWNRRCTDGWERKATSCQAAVG